MNCSTPFHPTSQVLWTNREHSAALPLVEMALQEDLGCAGDLTSQAVIPKALEGKANFVAREPGVVAGLPLVRMIYAKLSPQIQVQWSVVDGAALCAGDRLGQVGAVGAALLLVAVLGLTSRR